jgi:hypothetical protein
MWLDDIGDVWLFGGSLTSDTTTGFKNDLWKYSLATGQWTWVDGSPDADKYGNYSAGPMPPVSPPVNPPVSTPVDSPNSPAEVPVPPAGAPVTPSGVPVPLAGAPVSGPSSQVVPVSGPAPTEGAITSDAQVAIGVVVSAVGAGAGLLVLLLLLKRRKKQKAKKTTTVTVPMETRLSQQYDVINVQNDGNNSTDYSNNGTYQNFVGVTSATSEPATTPNTITTGADNRLIPYTSVTLEKEIGVGSFGKGKCDNDLNSQSELYSPL